MGKLPAIIVDDFKREPNVSIVSLDSMEIIDQLEFLTKTISKLEAIRSSKGKELQKYVELHNFE